MKTIKLGALLLSALLFAACGDDDEDSVSQVFDVNVSVSLSNFYSSYDYNDTYHDINVTDDYRVFNSEYGFKIQMRTLFYNSNGVLVDSILQNVTNTNTIVASKSLPAGTYTAIATLTFADKSGEAWWDLVDKQKIVTAKLVSKNRYTKWCIMSYASEEFTVSGGQSTNVSLNPKPVGSLGYFFLQNFQYKNESYYGTVSDNGIRSLCVFGRNIATGYMLNPKADSRFEYLDDGGSNSWYFLSSYLEPTDFDNSWTFFKSNLYSYFYILSPNPTIEFGYVMKGEDTFVGYGNQRLSLSSGKTYLAYWDYFQVGNPYFGVANNNQWHRYNQDSRVITMGKDE